MLQGTRKPAHGAIRSSGVVLITVLVMLVVLTLLGNFGLQLALQQQRMTGNTRQQVQALHHAEYILQHAENLLSTLQHNPFSPDLPGDAFYASGMIDLDGTVAGIQTAADPQWSFAHGTLAMPGGNRAGHYLIQDLGLFSVPDPSAADATTPGITLQAFQVSARSQGARGASRTVQSIFVRLPLAAPAGTSSSTAASPGSALLRPIDWRTGPAALPLGRRSWIDLQE